MKTLLTACAMAALLAATPALQAGDISDATLAKLGLGGMERLSDAEGRQIRGQGFAKGHHFVPKQPPRPIPFPPPIAKPEPKPDKKVPKQPPKHAPSTTIDIAVNVNNHVEVSNVNKNLNVNVLQNHNQLRLDNINTNTATAAANAGLANGLLPRKLW